ncbi:hypothetical protein [Halorubrum sp. N11]|uniref:hypothetical protein n=1 Tax=Halorubrum sp. N11 TaxID=3402276 RepID=UPI003EBF62AA
MKIITTRVAVFAVVLTVALSMMAAPAVAAPGDQVTITDPERMDDHAKKGVMSGDNVQFPDSTFDRNENFPDSTFDRNENFPDSTFDRNENFPDSTFDRNENFPDSTFDRNENFPDSTFDRNENFPDSTFDGDDDGDFQDGSDPELAS